MQKPTLGEIRKAREIGRNYFMRFMWVGCADCGKERWVAIIKGELASLRCGGCARSGSRGVYWKGGRLNTVGGYIAVWVPDNDPFVSMRFSQKYVFEHRLIMARHLGRCLNKEEWVHHINGIRTDNRLENLMIVSKREHEESTLLRAAYGRIQELEQQLRGVSLDEIRAEDMSCRSN